MFEDLIRYDKLIDSAMRHVVKEALKEVSKSGLKGEHHFLLSFFTDSNAVKIPKSLKEKYPKEMTIVIQHQFDELIIDEEKFSVILSFDGKKEKITVPFMSLTSFADPGVKFGLKFNLVEDTGFLENDIKPKKLKAKKSKAKTKNKAVKSPVKNKKANDKDNIISLDSLRD